MKEYKEFIAFKSIFFFCSLPIRLDSYRGCTYSCQYCFSQSLNNRRYPFFKNPIPAEPKKLLILFKNLNTDYGDHPGLVRSCLRQKIPLHFGSISDPFQPCEKKYKVSYSFLKTLEKFHYPVVISTKSDLVATPEYSDLLVNIPSSVQLSFSTLDDTLASKIEPNAPLPSKRLETLEKLANLGLYTVARIQPFLYPMIKIEDINFSKFSEVGVKHIVLEHLRIPTNSPLESRRKLFENIGTDILEEYRKEGIKISRISYELSSEKKLISILKAKDTIHSLGMTYGSGDNDFHHLSDFPCCCGLPDDHHFSNYYKGNFCTSVFNSMQNGMLSFGNIDDEWQPEGSAIEYINSHCRHSDDFTIRSLLLENIKNSDSSNSPLSFWGVECNDEGIYNMTDDLLYLVTKGKT